MGNGERLIAVDALKGLGILLVIFAHEIGSSFFGYTLFQVIYSFHMPLFFILSGYTSRPCRDFADWRTMLVRSFCKMLIPCLAAGFALLLIEHKNPWLSMIFACAGNEHINWCGADVFAIGPIWFCFALYVLRATYDGLGLVCGKYQTMFVLWSIGYVFGVRGLWLPWGLDIAMATFPFYMFGRTLKRWDFREMSWKIPVASGLFWALFALMTVNRFYPGVGRLTSGWVTANTLGIGVRSYPFHPVGFCAAGAIVMCLLWAFTKCSMRGCGGCLHGLGYIGRFSFWLLLVHQFDSLWRVWRIWNLVDLTRGMIRVGVDVFLFLLVRSMYNLMQRIRHARSC